MKTTLVASLIGIALASPFYASAWADSEIVGVVPKITTKFVEIDGASYPLMRGDSQEMRRSSPDVTECWSRYRTTCGTLAGIGFIDRARVTVRNGYAVRIEVLELKQ